MPYISSLPITTISTRQQGPCTAKLFITLRGGQKHAWFLHSMPLPFFSLPLMQRNSRGRENDIQALSPSLCGHRGRRRLHFLQLPWGWGWVLGCVLWHTRRPLAYLPCILYGRKGWVAPRGPMHNLGRLCIHIHLYQWATGKCKPKVIALDKNICLVNKYSNEVSSQVPQTDARLTGLRRDRR